MKNLSINWKTTAAGVAVILLGTVAPVFGVHVPGFEMDPGLAVVTGLGLIFAKDGNVTGGSVKQ